MGMPPRSYLVDTNQDLLEEWDYQTNKNTDINTVATHTPKKFGWKCKTCDFKWQASVNSRTGSAKSGCPACAGRALYVGMNDLLSQDPEIAKLWDSERNEKAPNEVTISSTTKYWWECDQGHTDYRSVADKRINIRHCIHCRQTSKKPVAENSLAGKYPEIAKEWHPTKNGKLKPEDVTPKSNKNVWWLCETGNLRHEWKVSVTKRTSRGFLCPFCSNKRLLKGDNDLKHRYPEIAKEWHPTKNGSLQADDVFPGTVIKYWWLCSACSWSWEASPNKRTSANRGCVYCTGQKRRVGENDLATTHKWILKHIHPTKNKGFDPTSVGFGSNKKLWFVCENTHEYYTSIKEKVKSSTSCPMCFFVGSSHIEQEFYKAVKEKYPNAKNNHKIDMPLFRARNLINVDIIVDNVIIEYDGSRWHSPSDIIDLDKEKTRRLIKEGYSVIRIRENELPFLNIRSKSCAELRHHYKKENIPKTIESLFQQIDLFLSK